MSTKIKGIDVSKWQGSIDWPKVAGDGVKFAMIRLGYGSKAGTGGTIDPYFEKNVEGALATGVAVGVYFYSYALTVEAVKKEAAFVIEQLAKYRGRILYPIAFDIEDSTQRGLGKATLTEMVRTFCAALEAAGYYASFYSNADWARNRLDMAALSSYDFWLAQWAAAPTYSGHAFTMWQSSDSGRVAGISGGVDLDTAFVDFEALIKSKGLNGYAGSAAAPGTSAQPEAPAGISEQQLRQKVVSTAVGYLGCKESDGSHKKIIDIYNSHKPLARGYKMPYTVAWCATFVSAVSILCELTAIMPTECGCERMIELYKKLGRWQENDAHVPSPGDVIFYDWDDSGKGDDTGWSDHVGIVVSVSGSSIKVIEGNKSDAVGYRTIAVNAKGIRGFGLPDYASAATTQTPQTPPASNPGGTAAPEDSSGAPSGIKVGDVVQFTGSKHYTNMNAASGPSCKPGPAKVTAIRPEGKHPYHLIAVSGSGSTVYGWVDAADVGGTETPAAPAQPAEIAVGDVVQFAGGPHYKSSDAASPSAKPKAGPARVTRIAKGKPHPFHVVHTDKQSTVYGWVDADKVTK